MEKVKSVEQLECLCTSTPLQLFFCDKDFVCAATFQESTKYEWAIELKCGLCSMTWHLCKCCKIRAKMVTDRQLKLHHKKYHYHCVDVPNSSNTQVMTRNIIHEEKDVVIMMNPTTPSQDSTNTRPASPQQEPLPNIDSNSDSFVETHDDDDYTNSHNNNIVPVEFGKDTASRSEPDFYGSTMVPSDWGLTTQSKSFFRNLRERKNALGCLIGQAHFLLPNVGGSLEVESVQLYLHYAFLLRKVTPKVQSLVVRVMKEYKIFLSWQRHKEDSQSMVPFTSIQDLPFSQRDIRSSFFKGKYSLFPNMPLPNIHRHPTTSHSYVIPSEVLAWFLGFSTEFVSTNYAQNARGSSLFPLADICQTKRIQSLLELKDTRTASIVSSSAAHNYYHFFMTEWGDDFEPNYGSHNRGSVFIKTLTILTTKGIKKESASWTFPVILGAKGDQHSLIEKILQEDLVRLQSRRSSAAGGSSRRNLFQTSLSKQPVDVNVDLVASICDQPARREYVGVAAGAGLYSARWGYVGNWVDCQRFIPCCEDCKKFIIDHSTMTFDALVDSSILLNGNCDKCSCWIYDIRNPLLSYIKPVGYPTSDLPSSPPEYNIQGGNVGITTNTNDAGDRLRPFKLDFHYLKLTIKHTHDCVVGKTWSIKEAKIFLKTLALSEKTIEEIVDCADNCVLLNDSSLEEDMKRMIAREKLISPKSFLHWQPPVSWSRRYGVDLFNNAPMHLLAGISKTTHTLALEWIKPQFDVKSFIKHVHDQMSCVHSLGLTWCRLPPKYDSKFVGALSENKVNLARLSCWLFSALPKFHSLERFSPPAAPQRMWLKRHNMSWLKERGLNTKGSADVVRERVGAYMSLPTEHIPTPLWITRSNVNLVLNVMHRMTLLFCWVLKSVYQCEKEIDMVDLRVRCFLQFFHEMDNEIINGSCTAPEDPTDEHYLEVINGVDMTNSSSSHTARRKPHWITSYNFLSLLNLRDEITRLGPLRCLWEGGYRGEKYVSEVKPMINSGLIKDWSHHLMKRLWMEKTVSEMDSLLTEHNEQVSSTGTSNEKSNKNAHDSEDNQQGGSQKMFCRYDSFVIIGFTIGKREAMSVVRDSLDCLFFVIQSRNATDEPRLLPCSLGGDTPYVYCGMKYYVLNFVPTPQNCYLWADYDIVDYGILLPLQYDASYMTENYKKEAYYTLVTNNWSESHMAYDLVQVSLSSVAMQE